MLLTLSTIRYMTSYQQWRVRLLKYKRCSLSSVTRPGEHVLCQNPLCSGEHYSGSCDDAW